MLKHLDKDELDKQRRIAMLAIHLDNHIHDSMKAYLTWLPILKITYPDFIEYYKNHGLHNIEMVLKE